MTSVVSRPVVQAASRLVHRTGGTDDRQPESGSPSWSERLRAIQFALNPLNGAAIMTGLMRGAAGVPPPENVGGVRRDRPHYAHSAQPTMPFGPFPPGLGPPGSGSPVLAGRAAALMRSTTPAGLIATAAGEALKPLVVAGARKVQDTLAHMSSLADAAHTAVADSRSTVGRGPDDDKFKEPRHHDDPTLGRVDLNKIQRDINDDIRRSWARFRDTALGEPRAMEDHYNRNNLARFQGFERLSSRASDPAARQNLLDLFRGQPNNFPRDARVVVQLNEAGLPYARLLLGR